MALTQVSNSMLSFDGGALSGTRNKIIGGDFTTNPWQRGTSFVSPSTGTYTADRWMFGNASAGVVSVLKTADAPTAAQAGVYTGYCLHVDVTTADASVAAGDQANIQTKIEGLNIVNFGFGQAGTRYATLSFWHKHTKTGTYCVAFRNGAANRSYVAEYVQNVTDTWELATVTFAVDTTGTWATDNTEGVSVTFAIMAGSTYQTTANTWAAGNYIATSNQVNAFDNTANNFKIALVQLEYGPAATPFEQRMYQTELMLCQRYYEKTVNLRVLNSGAGASSLRVTWQFRSEKRQAPTITVDTGASENVTAYAATLVQSTSAGSTYDTGNVTASAEL